MREAAFAISRLAQTNPQHLAVIEDDDVVTFGELHSRATQWARYMCKLGVQPGDRVLFLLRNSIALVEVTIGLMRRGVVQVPVNIMSSQYDLERLCTMTKAKLLITERSFRAVTAGLPIRVLAVEDVQEAVHAQTDEVVINDSDLEQGAHVFFSSGTTGVPKGIVVKRQVVSSSHGEQALSMETCLFLRQLTNRANYQSAMNFLQDGGTLAFVRSSDPDYVMKQVAQHQINLLVAPPSELTEWLKYLEPSARTSVPDCLTRIMSTGAPLTPIMKQRLLAHMPTVRVTEVYGCSEAGMITFMDSEDWEFNLTSCGRPAFFVRVNIMREDGTEASVGEVGEICVASPFLMDGYYENETLTRTAYFGEYYRTGDVGYVDEEGWLYLKGRKQETINRGSMKFQTVEVEAALEEVDPVEAVAVVGLPDGRWGQLPIAFVVLRPDWRMRTDEAQAMIREFAQRRLTQFKIPAHYMVVERLPYNASGKVDKPELVRIWNEQVRA